MTAPIFDAAGFVSFDLNAGEIKSAGKERLALLPFDALEELQPGEGLRESIHKWGKTHGERLSRQLSDTTPVGIEVLADHLGGTIATLGIGSASIEIQGDALFFRVRQSGDLTSSPRQAELICSFVAGYLTALGPGTFQVLSVGLDQGSHLLWAGHPQAAELMEKWIAQGTPAREAARRLADRSSR